MTRIAQLSAISICALVAASAVAKSQGLEVKRYNPSEWTKGRFSEAVTVTGPGKTIYLAGVGAEEYPAAVRRWADSVWEAWREHHAIAREWIAAAGSR